MRWVAALFLLCVSAIAAQADDPIELRAANYLPPMSVAVSQIMQPWMAEVEKATDGQVTLQGYWGGSLGRGAHRQYLLVESGVSDVNYLFLSMHAGRFSDLEILEIPTLFHSSEELSVIGWQLFEDGLIRGFEDVHVLGLFATAPGRLFTKTEIKTFADYQGQKFRAAGQLQGAYVAALGATPEIIDAATATDALRRGTIDGLVQGWSGMAIFRQADETDYFLDIPVGALPFAIVMNKKRWESLSPALQEQIMSVSGAALSRFAGQAYDMADNGFRQRFVDNGDLTPGMLSDADQQRIADIIDHVRDVWVAQDTHREKLLKRVEELKGLRDGG